MTQMTYRHPSPPLVPRRTKRTKNRWDLQWLGKWQTVPSIWSGEISREVCDTVCIRCCSTCFFEYCSYGGILCIHWVHFRFGRFGDELLFGTQHVLNVHFGSRPKWTCKVQTQGLCFCDTRCVLVFRCPLNSVGVSHLSGATWSWLPL